MIKKKKIEAAPPKKYGIIGIPRFTSVICYFSNDTGFIGTASTPCNLT